MNLRKQIEDAFAKTPRPEGRLVDCEGDDEGTSEYFANKTWRDHSVKDLRYHETAMCFFTPEAHRYFLPAFMIASLENSEVADVIPENIISHFAKHQDPFWQRRIELFSSAERAAITAFIKAIVSDYSFETEEVTWALEGLEKWQNDASHA